MLPWLHPTVVHFAIALLFSGLLLDLAGLWRTSEKLVFAGYWNTLLGAAAALVAVATGLLAEHRLGPHSGLGDALLGFHRIFGFAIAVLAIALAAARVAMKGYIRPRARTLYLATAFLTSALVLIGGGLGGAMVYAYGLGISPEAAHRVVEANKAPAPQAPPVAEPQPPDPAAPAPANVEPATATPPAKKTELKTRASTKAQ